jgi:hypothetical protein
MDQRDQEYERAAKAAAQEFEKWPDWKKSPPSVPIEKKLENGGSDKGKNEVKG